MLPANPEHPEAPHSWSVGATTQERAVPLLANSDGRSSAGTLPSSASMCRSYSRTPPEGSALYISGSAQCDWPKPTRRVVPPVEEHWPCTKSAFTPATPKGGGTLSTLVHSQCSHTIQCSSCAFTPTTPKGGGTISTVPHCRCPQCKGSYSLQRIAASTPIPLAPPLC